MNSLGFWIRSGRAAKSMNQHDLADAVGVGVPHISKIEAGRENPSEALLQRIAVALDLDADELLIASGRIPERFMEALVAHPTEAVCTLTEFAMRFERTGIKQEESR